MNLSQYVAAYAAIQGMMGNLMDYDSAHAVMVLKKKLEPHATFYADEEMKLAQEYATQDANGNAVFDGNGNFTFQDPSRAPEFASRRKELGDVAVQEDGIPIQLKARYMVTPTQLEALEGFIEWETSGS